MTRLALPSLGAVAILWAIYAIVQMYPARAATAPPVAPPVSEFAATVAAVGLVEPSSENISVGSPLAAVPGVSNGEISRELTALEPCSISRFRRGSSSTPASHVPGDPLELEGAESWVERELDWGALGRFDHDREAVLVVIGRQAEQSTDDSL